MMKQALFLPKRFVLSYLREDHYLAKFPTAGQTMRENVARKSYESCLYVLGYICFVTWKAQVIGQGENFSLFFIIVSVQ